MAKKKTKEVTNDSSDTAKIESLEAFRRKDAEAILYLNGRIIDLEARLDRIVAALSRARRITKDM